MPRPLGGEGIMFIMSRDMEGYRIITLNSKLSRQIWKLIQKKRIEVNTRPNVC